MLFLQIVAQVTKILILQEQLLKRWEIFIKPQKAASILKFLAEICPQNEFKFNVGIATNSVEDIVFLYIVIVQRLVILWITSTVTAKHVF